MLLVPSDWVINILFRRFTQTAIVNRRNELVKTDFQSEGTSCIIRYNDLLLHLVENPYFSLGLSTIP